MRSRIFLSFAVFTLVTILLLWLAQIVFLDDIYSYIKRGDLKTAVNNITRHGEASVEDAVVSAAQKKDICCLVFKINGDGTAERIASAHIQNNCMLHGMIASSNAMMNRLYDGAKTEKYNIEAFSLDPGIGVRPADKDMPNESDGGMSSLVCSSIAEIGGEEYLILLNCEMVPVDATVDTLTLQLGVITAVLVALAAVLAYFISAHLSRPLISMSREAKRLALGTYDVNFTESGSKETAELGATLNYAASELSQLDTMQKELISNISHDLRTPLTMISGYSQVMRDLPGEMTAENMQIIIDETDRLNSLVNDMLDLSRISGGRAALEMSRFSLTEAIAETVDRYAHLKERDGYKIGLVTDGEVFVNGDKTRLLQVIYNLVSNAINYTGDDKSVTVKQITDGGTVRVEVTDTGDGIPEDKLSEIWERYYRGTDFHRRPVVGSGLGLAIAKNCLVMHGAKFGVSSTLGQGSTFWFELPTIK